MKSPSAIFAGLFSSAAFLSFSVYGGGKGRTFAAAALGLLFLGACALETQAPLTPPAAFSGPRLEDDAIVSFDGAELALQTWLPEDAPWAAVVAVHGMSEYADQFYLAGPWWAERGVAVYAFDQRGFGRSAQRGVWAGSDLMARDIQTAAELVGARHPDAVLGVLGVSMGAAAVMVAEEAAPEPLADRLILVAPAVRGWSNLPLHYRASLWLAARLAPGRAVRPPRGVSIQASDNIEALLKNGRDPLFLHDTRFDMIYGLVSLMEDASQTSPGGEAPTFYLHGARDEVIAPELAFRAVERLGPCSRTAFYEDGWHMMLRDLQAEVVWRDVDAFLRDPSQPVPSHTAAIPGAAETNDMSACGQ